MATAIAGAVLGLGIYGIWADWMPMMMVAFAVYVPATLMMFSALPHHGARIFGPANTVTAIRLAATSYVAAAMFVSDVELLRQGELLGRIDDPRVWSAVLIALAALALDGVDGWLARRTGLSSDFGARFDMEVDAALILMLAIAAWSLGKVAPWVIMIGAARYIFIVAQAFVPALRAPLAPSFARKAICVVQVATLCVIVMPVVPDGPATVMAAIAAALLGWSFGRDVLALLNGRTS